MLLRGAQRLFMADVAARVSALGECVSYLPPAGGKFEQMHDRLRELWRSREERRRSRLRRCWMRNRRSSPQGGPSGYDAGKKVKGRKRNLVVDSLGLLLR